MKQTTHFRRLAILLSSLLATSTVASQTGVTSQTIIDGLVYEIRYEGEGYDAVPLYGILCNEVDYKPVATSLDNIPQYVTCEYSFYDGPEYKTRYLTAPVTLIGKYAFNDSPILQRVTIPEYISVIYSDSFRGAFGGSTRITELNWNARNCNTMGYMNKESIERVTIGPEVTLLPGNFVAHSKITEVTIPESVTTIGGSAFFECHELTKVNIPNGVTMIKDNTFMGCSSLANITIPNSVTSIGKWAFPDCSGLTNITIPNSVTEIGFSAFEGCTGLTSITIPNSVTEIGSYAFNGCSGLTSVDIPNSLNSISGALFRGCSSLTNITIPNSVTNIRYSAFEGCTGLTSITIPNSVTTIGDGAFYGCSGLTSITIPNSVTTIGYRAFYGCI